MVAFLYAPDSESIPNLKAVGVLTTGPRFQAKDPRFDEILYLHVCESDSVSEPFDRFSELLESVWFFYGRCSKHK